MSPIWNLDVIVFGIILKSTISYIVYGYAAFSDWIKREINPLIWIPPTLFGITINVMSLNSVAKHIEVLYGSIGIIQLHTYLSIAVSIMIILLLSVLSFVLGLLGGADVLSAIAFVSVYPSNLELMYLSQTIIDPNNSKILLPVLFLPPIVIVFILYTFTVFVYLIHNVIHNLTRIKEIKQYEVSCWRKLHYVLFGKVVKVEEVLNKRFYYPIYIPGVLERLTFNVEEDDTVWIDKMKNLPPTMTIVVTWGIPMVTLISIAVFIYVTCYLVLLII